MGETARKVVISMDYVGDNLHKQTRNALIDIADGIDEVKDLIKNSHNIQMSGSRADDLGDKRARALMTVVQKMIVRYQNQHRNNVDEEIFKLFEKAKSVFFSKNKTELQAAIADL